MSDTRNMYDCKPCPKCGSEFRWPQASTKLLVCDDCGRQWPYVERTEDHMTVFDEDPEVVNV